MNNSATTNRSFSGLQVFMMIIAATALAIVITAWVILSDIFATEFEPVKLNAHEEQVLSEKLERLGTTVELDKASSSAPLDPEAYSEEGAKREISFSEKEVNAMLAKNTNLASKLAIDLADDLMSLKLLLPIDDDFPVFGGETLKLTAGVELAYIEDKPVVIVKGVSVWGVPVPNAYLGDIKNIDLIQNFGDTGFWKTFADGLNDLRVEEGAIYIKVKP